MSQILIDTNVLVYAHDQNELVRQTRALDVLRRLELTGAGSLSVQNLGEFFSVTTHRLKPPLSAREAEAQIDLLIQAFQVFDLTVPIIREAARGAREYQFSYYDAQIWATARLNQIPAILSEDLNVGATIEGVMFLNPFASTFVMDDVF